MKLTEVTNNNNLKLFKKEMNLDFLDDTEILETCKFCIENKISKRELKRFSSGQTKKTFDKKRIPIFISHVKLLTGKPVIYEPSYYKYKFNLTDEESIQYIENLKKSKSTSLESFIKRHGDVVGREKFDKFKKTSSYTNSDERFKKLYGDRWQFEKKKYTEESNRLTVSHWMKKGKTLDESKKIISEIQKNSAGVNKQYWINKGYSNDEINVVMLKINKKKGLHNRNKLFLKNHYPNSWEEKWFSSINKIRKNMEDCGRWIKNDLLDDFIKYKKLVWVYTNLSIQEYELGDIDKRSTKFSLDHKYSIKKGYVDDIPAKIIGSICNLEIIPSIENSKKKEKCSISKEKLLENYKNLITTYESKKNNK